MKRRGMSLTRQRLKYVASDFVTTSVSFFLFNICRYHILHNELPSSWSLSEFLSLPKLLWEQALIPVAMLAVYWLSGYYNRPFERSRLNEFINTFYSALFNATLIFFILLINDRGPVVSADYLLICVSFLLLLLFTYSGRLLITSSAFRCARKKNIRNNVLIIGTSIQGH